MSDIQHELRHVLADLKRSAPGLTHIHAQIENILAELAGFDHGGYLPGGFTAIANTSGTAEPVITVIGAGGVNGYREFPVYNPEFVAGVTLPTNAKRIQDADDAESDKVERAKAWAEEHDGEPYIYGSDDPAEEWDEDQDLAHLDDEEDESGDATDAA
ncbi:hypothetical protein ACFYU5_19225 [Nocardia aobensis]|uniref:Uncharacterized protein n=1 Tax=Nocardia aobensis TaxID=257277 RepID=A0ABW6P5W4_9NOCA